MRVEGARGRQTELVRSRYPISRADEGGLKTQRTFQCCSSAGLSFGGPFAPRRWFQASRMALQGLITSNVAIVASKVSSFHKDPFHGQINKTEGNLLGQSVVPRDRIGFAPASVLANQRNEGGWCWFAPPSEVVFLGGSHPGHGNRRVCKNPEKKSVLSVRPCHVAPGSVHDFIDAAKVCCLATLGPAGVPGSLGDSFMIRNDDRKPTAGPARSSFQVHQFSRLEMLHHTSFIF